MHKHDNVLQNCEVTYKVGHVNTRLHLWKLATWRSAMWRTYCITAYCSTVLYADCVSSVPRLTLLELWMHSQRASQMMLVVKNLPPNAGDVRDMGSIPGLGRFPWRRKWQPTLVFLPGKFHRQRSLVGDSPWGRKESGTTEATEHSTKHSQNGTCSHLGED